MADDAEKTEEPSSKKLEDAKKEGNVPRSQDTSAFITLVVAVVVVYFATSFITSRIEHLYRYYSTFIGTDITSTVAYDIALTTFKELILMVIPLSAVVALAGIIAAVVQFGFVFTTKPLTPDLKKIDPIKGLGKLFSMKKLIEAVKITAKVAIIFAVAFYFLIQDIYELPTVINFNLEHQIGWLVEKIIMLVAIMLMILFILAMVDLMIVRFQYFKDLRMSKQEVKDEYKQMEGDPQVKARIKKIQMEMAQKRMMAEIPTADVIITNPTHYAVALRYNKERENAPRVIAKGIDNMALKIKEIAREHDIQIVENPPLARELYAKCDIDELIPENFYQAVAEVLAFIYKAKNKAP
jgi:flagellar biosynthetic protein FlhB